MKNSFTLIVVSIIYASCPVLTQAQVSNRVNELILQAQDLAESARDSAANRRGPIQNPFSRAQAGQAAVVPRPAAGVPAVDITDSAIRIDVGGQSITVPRKETALVPPNGPGVDPNWIKNAPSLSGGVTINGLPVGGCLLNKGVEISERGEVTIDREGSMISTAAYRELAAGIQAFGKADFSAAEKHLEHSVATNPSDPLAHSFYSLTLFANGNYDAAAEYAYSAAATSPLWDWNQLRSCYRDPAQYANHYKQLQLAARQSNAKPGTHFLLAWHHLMLGHREAAQVELELVLRELPNDPVVSSLLKLAREQIVAPPEPLK